MNRNNVDNKWKRLKQYLRDYKEIKSIDYPDGERYCIAISIDDMLKKMDEIEGGK